MRMNCRTGLSSVAAVLCAGVLAVSVARSQEKPKAAPAMSAEEQAMMAAMTKAAEPGPEHKRLAEMVGTWESKSRMFKPDGTDCGSGTGTMTAESVLGGRYVRMTFKGEMASPMGTMPYNGTGQVGYDNITKKYVSIWSDDMSTRPMVTEGTASGDVLTTTGQYPDAVTGKMTAVKDVSTRVSATESKYELFMTAPDGKMYRCMEMTSTKK